MQQVFEVVRPIITHEVFIMPSRSIVVFIHPLLYLQVYWKSQYLDYMRWFLIFNRWRHILFSKSWFSFSWVRVKVNILSVIKSKTKPNPDLNPNPKPNPNRMFENSTLLKGK